MRDRDRERKTRTTQRAWSGAGINKQTHTHRTQCSFNAHTDSVVGPINKINMFSMGKMHLLHMHTKLLNDAESKHIEN